VFVKWNRCKEASALDVGDSPYAYMCDLDSLLDENTIRFANSLLRLHMFANVV